MRLSVFVRRLLIALSIGALLGSPLRAHADGEVILHITDTHVTASSAGNLPAFVDVANRVADGVTLVAHSGDAASDPTSAADFDAFWAQINRLTVPAIVVPGNHDLTGTRPGATWTFPHYLQATAGEYAVIGFDAYASDWDRLEDMMREAARGGKRLILMEHQPVMIPHWLTSCSGSPCTAPKWLLDNTSKAKLQDLIARYDVSALLVGHLHAQYQMRDPNLFYDHIATANLGSPISAGRNYSVVIVDNGNFVAQMTRYSDAPIAITSPVYYDTESGVGQILEPAPIRVRIIGASEAARVRSVTITKPAVLAATQAAPGVWEANYDWKLKAGRGYQSLSADVLYTNGVKRTLTMPFQVAASYPNPAPTVALAVGAAEGSNRTVTLAITDNAAELKQADLLVEGARVRSWSLAGKSAANLTWIWDATTYPGAWFKVKVVDVFGRKRYADNRAPEISPTPKITPTPSPAATATPTSTTDAATATPTPSPTPTLTPEPSACMPGRLTLSPILDTYIFKYAAHAEDAAPATAEILRTSGYSPTYRALVRFDLSDVPAAAQIASANLSLGIKTWYYPDGITPTVSLARLGKAFDASASWTQAAAGVLWDQAGAAAAGTDILTPSVEKKLIWGKNAVDITAWVREWAAAPASNTGLRISVVTASHSVIYYAAEAASNQPSLAVDYFCPSAPAPAEMPAATG